MEREEQIPKIVSSEPWPKPPEFTTIQVPLELESEVQEIIKKHKEGKVDSDTNPEAERLEKVLNDLHNLGLEAALANKIFPAAKFNDPNNKEGILWLWSPSRMVISDFNRYYLKSAIPLYIEIIFSTNELILMYNLEKTERVERIYFGLSQFNIGNNVSNLKKNALTSSYKNEIVDWMETQIKILNKEYQNFQKRVNDVYNILYFNKVVSDSAQSLWKKVVIAKDLFMALRDELKLLDSSVELLEKTKDAFKSSLVTEAKKNLLEIKNSKYLILDKIRTLI